LELWLIFVFTFKNEAQFGTSLEVTLILCTVSSIEKMRLDFCLVLGGSPPLHVVSGFQEPPRSRMKYE